MPAFHHIYTWKHILASSSFTHRSLSSFAMAFQYISKRGCPSPIVTVAVLLLFLTCFVDATAIHQSARRHPDHNIIHEPPLNGTQCSTTGNADLYGLGVRLGERSKPFIPSPWSKSTNKAKVYISNGPDHSSQIASSAKRSPANSTPMPYSSSLSLSLSQGEP